MADNTIKKPSLRMSNLELLRLLCMFAIILRHYSTQAWWGEFTAETWTWRKLFLQLIIIGGSTSNNIFLLITGYYMINKNVNWKKVIALIAQMTFYSWIIMAILFGFKIIPFSFFQFFQGLFPILSGYNWYVCCYVILCCFLPFLNPYLNSLSKEKYKKLLIVLILIWSVAYSLKATTYMGTDFSIDHFVIIYALGGYINKFGINFKKIPWKYCFILSSCLLILSVIILSCGGAYFNSDYMIKNATWFSEATNILDITIAISLFMWVINSKPFYNKIINLLAKTVIGIFIIHMNPLLKNIIWYDIFPNGLYANSKFLVLHCLIKVSCVFVSCLIIDLIRLATIDRIFNKLLDKIYPKIIKATKSQ